jgi:hypothetical protein
VSSTSVPKDRVSYFYDSASCASFSSAPVSSQLSLRLRQTQRWRKCALSTDSRLLTLPRGGSGDVGTVYYGANHPMKPHRLVMTHHLVMAYDLHKRMEIYVRG